ncbi:11339_t:CDS:1, partial [Paraglomus occultum]
RQHQHAFVNDTLRKQALTHKSYHYENPKTGPHNERLEFLGDSIVSFVVANFLFSRYPDLKEGQLTLLRANLVCKKSLAKFALQLKLDEGLLLGVGALRDGGKASEKVLEDAFEAYVGAVYLDSGSSMNAVQKFMEPLLLSAVEELTRGTVSHVHSKKEFSSEFKNSHSRRGIPSDLQDPINKLQTWSQRNKLGIPIYRDIEAPNALFVVNVCINEHCLGSGKARNKKDAKKEAAMEALKTIESKTRIHGMPLTTLDAFLMNQNNVAMKMSCCKQ